MNTTPTLFHEAMNASLYGKLEESAQLFRLGHEQGLNECTAQLACCYREGHGVPRDYNEYFKLATALEQKECPLAYCLLANAYADGLGCKVDREKAMSYLKRWAEASAAPIPGISDECRLYMRCYDISDSFQQALEYYAANTGEPLLIDPDASTREYAEHTTLADKPVAQVLALQASTPQGAPTPPRIIKLLEQAYQDGVSDAAFVLGTQLLTSCSEDDEATRNRALALINEEENSIEEVSLLVAKLRCLQTDDEEAFASLHNRLMRSMQYGLSGMPRADELPCKLETTPSPYSGVFYVYDIETTEHFIDKKQWDELTRPLSLPDLTIINTDTKAFGNLDLRIIAEGTLGESTTTLEGSLPPGEKQVIYLNDYASYYHNTLRVELHAADGRYTTIRYEKDFLDLISEPMPPLQLVRNEDSLIIIPRDADIAKLQILTPDGAKIAELNNLNRDEAVSTDLWHLKSCLVKARAEAFLIVCDDGHPAVGFLK